MPWRRRPGSAAAWSARSPARASRAGWTWCRSTTCRSVPCTPRRRISTLSPHPNHPGDPTGRRRRPMADLPENLHYSEDHEWVADDNGVLRIGITEYAADQLGDIVYVTAPEEGQQVERGEPCGELESTKSVSDLICPVSGVVKSVNAGLVDDPGVINNDPYGEGWIFTVTPDEDDATEGLLDAAGYADHVG